MIQRIQTIYLFLAATAGFSVLALPFATNEQAVAGTKLFADKAFNTSDNIGLLVLFAVASALALAGIFLFKNRPVQVKIAWGALVANILGGVLALLLLFQEGFGGASIGIGAVLPIIFLVFGYLAIKGIQKDESTVRSVDRLR